MPFGNLDFDGPYRMSRYRGTIRWQDRVESYHPDLVARQFGRVQGVPQDIIRPTFAQRPRNLHHRYRVDFADGADHWAAPAEHLVDFSALPEIGPEPGLYVTPEYMEWYRPRSHPIVQPPEQPPPQHAPQPPPPQSPPFQPPGGSDQAGTSAAGPSGPPADHEEDPTFTQAMSSHASDRLTEISDDLWRRIQALSQEGPDGILRDALLGMWRDWFGPQALDSLRDSL